MIEYIAMGIGLTLGYYLVTIGFQTLGLIVEIIMYEIRSRRRG